jgi:hypothetical protein
LRPQQQQRRGNIGAVRIAERNRRRDAVLGSRLFDEIRELLRAVAYVVLVETAFSKAAKKSRFSKTLPRGESNGAAGAIMRPSGMRSFSSPPVPCSNSNGRASGSAPFSKR